MATRYMGMTTTGPQVLGSDVIGAASGGTLAGSQNVQVVFDDAVFDSTQEGKQKVLAAMDIIKKRVEVAKSWPISSSS